MTTIQTDAQRLQALQDESDRRHILAQKMISGGTPTPAAPSGELLADAVIWYDREETPEFVGHLYDNMAMIRITGSSERFGRYTTPLAAVSQAAPEQATPECALKGAEGLGLCVGSCTKLGYCIERTERARALAAPSGAPKQDTPQSICNDGRFMDALDGYMDAVTNDPRNSDRRVKCRLEVFAAADTWRAAASTVQSAPAKDDADPIGDFQAEDRQAKLDDFVASMRSAPVLPDDCPDHGDTVLRVQEALGITTTGWVSPDVILLRISKLVAAQSTPVQVEGQQEPQAHVMPPFAAPAGQHGAYLAAIHRVQPRALDESINELDDWLDSDGDEPLTTSEGESVALVVCALKRILGAGTELLSRCRAQGGIDEPNGAVQALALPVAAKGDN